MCGRYSVGKDPVRVAMENADDTFYFDLVFNAAPAQSLPVILLEKDKLVSRNMFWGFKRKTGELVINGKSETLKRKFGKFIQSRCLIPANGFYEWEQAAHGKLPWRFVLKTGKSFCFAGLYCQTLTDDHKQMDLDITDTPPASCIKESFLIITTNPNSLVQKVHNRMPVILEPTHYHWWLDESKSISSHEIPRAFGQTISTDTEPFELALQTFPASKMESYRVSQAVNNSRNNTQECFKPV